jgi:hypothetical protein
MTRRWLDGWQSGWRRGLSDWPPLAGRRRRSGSPHLNTNAAQYKIAGGRCKAATRSAVARRTAYGARALGQVGAAFRLVPPSRIFTARRRRSLRAATRRVRESLFSLLHPALGHATRSDVQCRINVSREDRHGIRSPAVRRDPWNRDRWSVEWHCSSSRTPGHRVNRFASDAEPLTTLQVSAQRGALFIARVHTRLLDQTLSRCQKRLKGPSHMASFADNLVNV